MIERFETYSGSIYEVDHEQKSIRRLSGTHDPVPRQGRDGEWKKFKAILHLFEGSRCVIVWDVMNNVAKTTITSQVVKCELV